VADYTRRPLYTISSGDLGVDPAGVERTLLDSLEVAAHWNAIVLLDEADIFLEQRSNHDLQRNGLVSGKITDSHFRCHAFISTNYSY
jgi:hypothetical protein